VLTGPARTMSKEMMSRGERERPAINHLASFMFGAYMQIIEVLSVDGEYIIFDFRFKRLIETEFVEINLHKSTRISVLSEQTWY
jgi:hypothetical protein